MALTNDILDDFFNLSKSQKTLIVPIANKKNECANTESTTHKKQYKNYRVFDDPLELDQTQDKYKTNIGQSWDKVGTNIGQKKETQDKVESELKTKFETNTRQSWDKVGTKVNFSSLVGLQRSIVLFLYEICKASRDKTTASLSIEHVAYSCKTTKSSAQKTIQRLEKKHILKRTEFKNGRSGWTRYELPEGVYQEILYNETQDKLKTNLGQSWDKVGTEPRTELKTTVSSSGGINNYINTTTTGVLGNSKSNNLSDEWLKIDIEPLSSIGFTQTHLMQIASQNILSAELVQGSIYAFDFDLRENNKAKSITGDPINFFMGILRKGKPYAPTSNYESPQDKAIRIYREKMSEIEQKRVETEKEAINLAFNDWFIRLNDEQKKNFLPEMFRHNTNSEKLGKSKILESTARSHFETEIWPKEKGKIISEGK
ncbi:conserved hypothetical protein [Gammaproteobacteria bacterium]